MASTSEVTIRKIEQVVLDIVRDLVKNKSPVLERENLALKGKKQKSFVEWSYKNSRRNFAVLLYLMDSVHWLVLTKAIRTKRELYYENVTLYGHQRILDAALSNLCEILQVQRAMLHVEATAKGLIAGFISWTGPNNEEFDPSQFTTTGMLIPSNLDGHHGFKSDALFILVVEKDAIFQKLLNDKIFDGLGKFILITGKGYPDFATRYLLRKLTDELQLPIFALVDQDPHGIEIAAIYKWGSYGQVRKANNDSSFVSELTVPDLIWIGLLPSEVANLGLSRKTIPMTNADLKKLASVEQRLRQQEGSQGWMEEIKLLKEEEKKAELEAVDSRFLSQIYLRSRIEMFIQLPPFPVVTLTIIFCMAGQRSEDFPFNEHSSNNLRFGSGRVRLK